MGWEDQGRQCHGWFGTGASGIPAEPMYQPPEPEEAAKMVVQLAAGRLSPLRRFEFDGIVGKGFGDRLTQGAQIWSAASHLAPNDFRRLVVGSDTPPSVAERLQALGRSLTEATSPHSKPQDVASSLDAAAAGLASVLSATRPGNMNYDASAPAHQAQYAAVNGLIPEPPPAPTMTVPQITVRPGDNETFGTPVPAQGQVPTIVAGLLTMAETLAPAILLRMLPIILGGLGAAVALAVVAELLRRLAQPPDAGGGPGEAPSALPPAPGLVPPAMPGGQGPGGSSDPQRPEIQGDPGFSPSPSLPGNPPTPAPGGPQGPVLSPMARPKPTPEELKRREEKLRVVGLPTEGEFPYVPPPTWTSSQPIPKVGRSGGYRDKDGEEWKRPTGHRLKDGKPNHWDVVDKNGGHRNITSEGKIHHGKR